MTSFPTLNNMVTKKTKAQEFSASTLKAAKPKDTAYKLFIGGGLYLEVLPSGAKSWRLKYRFNGTEKRMTFGLFPVITMADARNLAIDAKRLLAAGTDPQETKKAAQVAARAIPERQDTFKDVALEVFEQKRLRCTESYCNNYQRSLEIHLFPTLGDRPIGEIGNLEVLKACKTASEKGAYLSHKLAQRAGEVFDHAVLTERREYNPVTKATHKNLPRHAEKSFASIKADQIPEFYRDLAEYRGFPLTKVMIEFTLHTFLRTMEVRRLEWAHIDFDLRLIDIPSGKELNRKNTPLVPMSDQVIALLKKAREIVGEGNATLVFPMFRDYSRMASENVITAALRGMGWQDEMTGHGFRSLGRTTLEEIGGFHADHLELQLGHTIARNETEGAYRRVEFFPQRIVIMQWWSDYLDKQKHAKA